MYVNAYVFFFLHVHICTYVFVYIYVHLCVHTYKLLNISALSDRCRDVPSDNVGFNSETTYVEQTVRVNTSQPSSF